MLKDLYHKNPLLLIRYVLLIGAMVVMFINLFDCINKGKSLSIMFLYVGVLLISCFGLILIHNDFFIAGLFIVFGILTMIDIPAPNYLSGGIVFFLFSIRIVRNSIFNICIFFLTLLIIIANHIFAAASPGDAINIIIGYSIIYLLDLIFLKYNEVICDE